MKRVLICGLVCASIVTCGLVTPLGKVVGLQETTAYAADYNLLVDSSKADGKAIMKNLNSPTDYRVVELMKQHGFNDRNKVVNLFNNISGELSDYDNIVIECPILGNSVNQVKVIGTHGLNDTRGRRAILFKINSDYTYEMSDTEDTSFDLNYSCIVRYKYEDNNGSIFEGNKSAKVASGEDLELANNLLSMTEKRKDAFLKKVLSRFSVPENLHEVVKTNIDNKINDFITQSRYISKCSNVYITFMTDVSRPMIEIHGNDSLDTQAYGVAFMFNGVGSDGSIGFIEARSEGPRQLVFHPELTANKIGRVYDKDVNGNKLLDAMNSIVPMPKGNDNFHVKYVVPPKLSFELGKKSEEINFIDTKEFSIVPRVSSNGNYEIRLESNNQIVDSSGNVIVENANYRYQDPSASTINGNVLDYNRDVKSSNIVVTPVGVGELYPGEYYSTFDLTVSIKQ